MNLKTQISEKNLGFVFVSISRSR